MTKQDIYCGYLVDLIPLIQEKRLELDNEIQNDLFAKGQYLVYHGILEYMKNLAASHHFPIQALGLDVPMRFGVDANVWESKTDLNYQKFLKQLVAFVMHELKLAKHANGDLQKGKQIAFYDVLTVMNEQAVLAFQMEPTELGFSHQTIEELAF
jgi:hypothetical protein